MEAGICGRPFTLAFVPFRPLPRPLPRCVSSSNGEKKSLSCNSQELEKAMGTGVPLGVFALSLSPSSSIFSDPLSLKLSHSPPPRPRSVYGVLTLALARAGMLSYTPPRTLFSLRPGAGVSRGGEGVAPSCVTAVWLRRSRLGVPFPAGSSTLQCLLPCLQMHLTQFSTFQARMLAESCKEQPLSVMNNVSGVCLCPSPRAVISLVSPRAGLSQQCSLDASCFTFLA